MTFQDKYIASRYHVESQIGEGGMSIVYKAKDIVTGKDVAIKILKDDTLKNPTNIERFNREARATASLSHPNIVRVITVGTQDGRPYMITYRIRNIRVKFFYVWKFFIDLFQADINRIISFEWHVSSHQFKKCHP